MLFVFGRSIKLIKSTVKQQCCEILIEFIIAFFQLNIFPDFSVTCSCRNHPNMLI